MIFTNDDLSALKAHLVQKVEHGWTLYKLEGLIARLEAAEKVVKAHSKLENEQISYDDFNSLVAQWRLAAGQ